MIQFQPVKLDFGNDEEEEEEETELNDAISDEAKNEEPAEQELPATEAPVIAESVQSEGEEPAPTAAPALSIVRATRPPPVKKIVMVEMPPLSNLVKASEVGGEKSDAKGLVCVVFETPALFPTKKVADNSSATKKPKKGVVEPKVSNQYIVETPICTCHMKNKSKKMFKMPFQDADELMVLILQDSLSDCSNNFAGSQ